MCALLCYLRYSPPHVILYQSNQATQYISRQGRSDADFLIAQKYVVSGETPSGFESEGSYCKRMEGYVALYAAIVQTQSPNHNSPNPRGTAHGWAWLARLGNTKPGRVTATVLRVFLEVNIDHLLHFADLPLPTPLPFCINPYVL